MAAVSQSFKSELLGAIPSLRAFAVSLTQNADKADDLVQETLVKAWDKHESFQPGTNLKAWLFTILHNTARNRSRDRARSAVTIDSDSVERAAESMVDQGADTPEALLLKDTLNPDLQAAIDGLPEAFREAVWLRDVEDFTYAEIARVLQIPAGTVMSRISRGRRLLFERLQHLKAVNA